MANRKARSKISCEIRCIDTATVEAAARRLDPAGVEWVPYTCKLSGAKESVLLIGDDLAAEVMKSIRTGVNITGTKILACLYSAELCECDVATVTGATEDEVISQFQKFSSIGMVAHRKIQGMNYYRLKCNITRRSIKDAVDALC
jgi:hypothetical protein